MLHKFLTSHPRNISHRFSVSNISDEVLHPSIEEIKSSIRRYNLAQTVLNEEVFGPVQNDTIVIVIQVIVCITYFKLYITAELKPVEVLR